MAARRTLEVPAELAARIRRLHPLIKRKLRGALDEALEDPRCGKPLREELAGLRSLRVGRLRLIYREESRSRIALIAFGPRETIYEETHRLLRRSAGK